LYDRFSMPSASYVFPVRYVSEGVSVQTTSTELSAAGIAVRSLAPPQVGARVSLALYLPNALIPEVAIGRVLRSTSGANADAGFWADFLVLDPQARMRIAMLLADHDHGGQNRAFPRFPVDLELEVRKGSDLVGDRAVNLSRSGVFVRSDAPPEVSSAVEVTLRLPDGTQSVTSAGVVMHRREAEGGRRGGMGIQFVDASDEFRERVDRYSAVQRAE
jgi:uncharacterized protein (TIGR02266 family)